MNDKRTHENHARPAGCRQNGDPSIISSLVTSSTTMADTFFVGQTGDPLQVACRHCLTNPIFILFMAFAKMFGMGGSAAASIAMGENQ